MPGHAFDLGATCWPFVIVTFNENVSLIFRSTGFNGEMGKPINISLIWWESIAAIFWEWPAE